MATEDELYDMSDEELEAAFKEAKAAISSPESFDEEFEEAEQEPIEEVVDQADNEEYESDLEQPVKDSDHDAEEDVDEVNSTKTDVPSEDDGKPRKEPELSEEDQSEEVKGTAETDSQKVPVVHKFKADGKEYEFTDNEVKDMFPKIFGQAMNYTKKMQAIKPWRKTIDAIEQAELSHDDINLAIDVLKGDKDAIAEVIKRTGVDTFDINPEESNYVAKDYGRDELALEIDDIFKEISNDPEYSMTHNILANQWDEKSLETLTSDPKTIKLLHEDVKNGTYQKLQPLVDKYKLLDGGRHSDLEYYGMAAQEFFSKQVPEQPVQNTTAINDIPDVNAIVQAKIQEEAERIAKLKAEEEARKTAQQVSKKRKAAAPSKSRTPSHSVVDYLDDSDEAYEEWYAKVTGEKPIN